MTAAEYRKKAEQLLTQWNVGGVPTEAAVRAAEVWSRLAIAAAITEAAEKKDS
ncbi:hypothetical protein ACFWDI_35825 [Streptomyces sp. NPDC060064]|uniref:hypothetical protein n=1 Tax=Streptomyces sp. NPDC060064 TaxID=3347049 RepID=UPI00368351C3